MPPQLHGEREQGYEFRREPAACIAPIHSPLHHGIDRPPVRGGRTELGDLRPILNVDRTPEVMTVE